jgi:tRNA (guanine37-N1)-methyltransferase
MRIDVVSIFPDYLAPLGLSLVGKAVEAGVLTVRVHDLRDHAHDRHRTVDDSPYGGGPGMVMKPEPWGELLDVILELGEGVPRLVVPTPSGRPLTQVVAAELSADPWLVIACGRYEGIDQRVVDHYSARCRVDEISIGDYVLAGGEAAALVIVEAVARLIPGVLGNSESAPDDSFAPGRAEAVLEGPVYTKPSEWRGLAVPDVLRSGDHAAIARWRRERAVERTADRRPELVADLDVAADQP